MNFYWTIPLVLLVAPIISQETQAFFIEILLESSAIPENTVRKNHQPHTVRSTFELPLYLNDFVQNSSLGWFHVSTESIVPFTYLNFSPFTIYQIGSLFVSLILDLLFLITRETAIH